MLHRRGWTLLRGRMRGALGLRVTIGGGGLIDADDEVADVDLVRVLDDERTRDLATVDVRPVRTLQIDDDELTVLEHDARVALRHVAFWQHDVVALDAPDRHLGLVEHHAALFAAFFLNEYGEHELLRPRKSLGATSYRTVLSLGNHGQVRGELLASGRDFSGLEPEAGLWGARCR